MACCVGLTLMERFVMLEALAMLSRSLAICIDLQIPNAQVYSNLPADVYTDRHL